MPYEMPASAPRSDISLTEILAVLWRRRLVFLVTVAVCLGVAGLASHQMTRKWRADAEMVLVQRATNQSDPTKAAYAPPVVETIDTQMAMLQSNAIPQRASAWLHSQPDQGHSLFGGKPWTAEDLQRTILITNPKETNVIQVSAEAPSPQQAATLANAVCFVFLQWKKELARQQVRDIARSLEVRSARAKVQMRDAEQQEKLFKQQKHMADIPTQEKLLLDQNQSEATEVDNLQKEVVSLDARLQDLEKRLKIRNTKIQQGGIVRDDAEVLSLQTQLTQLEIERANAARIYTPNYPGIFPQRDAKIRDIKSRLNQSIHAIISANIPTLQEQGALLSDYQATQINEIYSAAKLAAARRLLAQTQAQTRLLPQIDGEYKQIVRTVDLTNTLYSSLQSSLEAARIDTDIASGNVQLTQPALVPVKPFKPNLVQNLALASLVGVFLGSLTIIFLEHGDQRMRTVGDLQRLLAAPVIGSLPVLPRPLRAALISGNGAAEVREAYRLTYANLLLALHQSKKPALVHRSVILVTSALPGEGKTVTARHLARTIARCGKRTILVNADLRVQPDDTLPASGELEPIGLADVLRGKVILEEAIVESGDRNLLLLQRGRVTEESGDMISLPQMKQILETLRSFADVVIVDTPACLERSDVFFIAPYADCILQVVSAERANETALRQVSDALAAVRPGLLALFFNFAPVSAPVMLTGTGPGPVSPLVTVGGLSEWDLSEKVLLSENRTTKIIVQSMPKPTSEDQPAWPYRAE